ncbi:MAG: cytochrome c [Oxalobacteraceae bacterium]|jgi:sulfite dehydrogenase|nr:MAG: cytochrome c [Oxalobacteraceae bacterium]
MPAAYSLPCRPVFLKAVRTLTLAALIPVLPTLAADEAAQMALGKKLFSQGAVPACAVCHTLRDAGAAGAIGPVLDDLQPNAARVAQALRMGIGQMPSYKDKLSEDQILALSLYVATSSGAK